MNSNTVARGSVGSRILWSLLLLTFVVAFGGPAFSQGVSGATIQGTLTDSSGGVLPGVTITATNTQTNQQRTAVSDGEGRFTIPNLTPGFYDLEASLSGFGTAVQKNRQLLVGTTVTIDFALQISAVTQEVIVTASAQVVDLTQSQVAKVIEPTTIDALPTLTRSFSDLASLSAGVVQGAEPGGGSNAGQSILVGGGTSYMTGIVVDGTPIANLRFGGAYLNFAQDWIQEFALISQQPAAEFGGAASGVVNAVTKSGTNTIRGRGYGFLQDSSLNAKPFFSSERDSSVRRVGGLVGGPVMRDRLFYFAGYEDFYSKESVDVNIPAAFVNPPLGLINGTFPIISKTKIATIKVNQAINAQHSLWGRWNYQKDHSQDGTIGLQRPIGASSRTEAPGKIYAGAWNWFLSSSTVSEVRANYNYTNLARFPNCLSYLGNYPGYPNEPGSTTGGNPVGYWAAINYPQAGGVSGRCATGAGAEQATYDTHFDIDVLHSAGRHQFKFGFGARRYGLSTSPDYRSATSEPTVTINGTAPFTFNLATAVPPTLLANGSISGAAPGTLPVAYTARHQTIREFDLPSLAFGLFVQDSWTVNPKLTLNLGLRWDMDLGGTGVNKYVSADRPRVQNNYKAVAPRFGAAWTPFDSKETVVRGGLGVFYDKQELNNFLAYVGNTPGVDGYVIDGRRPTLNPYCFGNARCSSGVVPGELQRYVQFVLAKAVANYTLPRFPAPGTTETITIGGTTLTIPAPVFVGSGGALLPAPVSDIWLIDPELTMPWTAQASVGIAHQFTDRLNASADFVYNRGFDQIVVINTNIDPVTLQPPVDPKFARTNEWNNGGTYKNYSMRFQSLYRTGRGDSVNAAYTLAWAYDNSVPGAQFGVGSAGAITNPFDLDVDYGPSLIDARHVLNLAGTANVGWGVSLSPIFKFVSARPYTATTSAAIVPGCPAFYNQCYAPGYTKNTLRGANQITLATRLSKNFTLGGRREAAVMLEAYNLLNRVNYTSYGTNVAALNFQVPTAAGPMRTIQLGVRFDF